MEAMGSRFRLWLCTSIDLHYCTFNPKYQRLQNSSTSKPWTDCICNTPALWAGPVRQVGVKPTHNFIPPVNRCRQIQEENSFSVAAQSITPFVDVLCGLDDCVRLDAMNFDLKIELN